MNTETVMINGHKLDTSDLDPRFAPFYESRERVEVTWKPGFEDYTGYGARTEGRKARFWVGRSTGWKPVYLVLLTRRSCGGVALLSSAVESVRGIGGMRRDCGASVCWKPGRKLLP